MQIMYSDGTETITMPESRKISNIDTKEAETITTASGKQVQEVKGIRRGFVVEWDYVPAATMEALIKMVQRNAFITVTYPTPDAGIMTGVFSLSMPNPNVWRLHFKGQLAVWRGISITHTAQELLKL